MRGFPRFIEQIQLFLYFNSILIMNSVVKNKKAVKKALGIMGGEGDMSILEVNRVGVSLINS